VKVHRLTAVPERTLLRESNLLPAEGVIYRYELASCLAFREPVCSLA